MMGDPETQREMQEMQRNMANTQNQVKIENIYYGNLWYGENMNMSCFYYLRVSLYILLIF